MMTPPVDGIHDQYSEQQCSPLAGFNGLASLPMMPCHDSASGYRSTAAHPLPPNGNRLSVDGAPNSSYPTPSLPSTIGVQSHPDELPLVRQQNATDIPAAPRYRLRELPTLEEIPTGVRTCNGTPTANGTNTVLQDVHIAPLLGIYNLSPPPAREADEPTLPRPPPNVTVQHGAMPSPVTGHDNTFSADGCGAV